MLNLREFVIAATSATSAAVRAKLTSRPRCIVIIREIDATVVPWVAIRVEASCRFDGNQRSLRDVGGAILEERARRLGAVLAAIEE